EKEITSIRTEKVLRQLDRQLQHIPDWKKDTQQLKRLGIRLPNTLPDGGQVIFSKQHQPMSSVAKKRYKLFQSPAHIRRKP
ncbi:MAG: hypothetical protein R8J84_01425, partial [Mariprofundales bacterium]